MTQTNDRVLETNENDPLSLSLEGYVSPAKQARPGCPKCGAPDILDCQCVGTEGPRCPKCGDVVAASGPFAESIAKVGVCPRCFDFMGDAARQVFAPRPKHLEDFIDEIAARAAAITPCNRLIAGITKHGELILDEATDGGTGFLPEHVTEQISIPGNCPKVAISERIWSLAACR